MIVRQRSRSRERNVGGSGNGVAGQSGDRYGMGFSSTPPERGSSSTNNGQDISSKLLKSESAVDNVFDVKLDKEAAQKKLEAEMQKRRERIEK